MEEVLAYIAQSTPIRADWVEKQPIDHTYFGLNRRWNKKWMALFPHLVVWYRHPRAVPRGYMILAANTAAAEDAAKGTSIEVVSPTGRKLRFRSSNAMGNAAWLADLRAVLMERLRELASHTEASAVQQHMNARRSIAMTAAPSYAIAPPPPPPPSAAQPTLRSLTPRRAWRLPRHRYRSGGGRGRRGVLDDQPSSRDRCKSNISSVSSIDSDDEEEYLRRINGMPPPPPPQGHRRQQQRHQHKGNRKQQCRGGNRKQRHGSSNGNLNPPPPHSLKAVGGADAHRMARAVPRRRRRPLQRGYRTARQRSQQQPELDGLCWRWWWRWWG